MIGVRCPHCGRRSCTVPCGRCAKRINERRAELDRRLAPPSKEDQDASRELPEGADRGSNKSTGV